MGQTWILLRIILLNKCIFPSADSPAVKFKQSLNTTITFFLAGNKTKVIFSGWLTRGTLFLCAKWSCAEGEGASLPSSCLRLLLRLHWSGMALTKRVGAMPLRLAPFWKASAGGGGLKKNCSAATQLHPCLSAWPSGPCVCFWLHYRDHAGRRGSLSWYERTDDWRWHPSPSSTPSSPHPDSHRGTPGHSSGKCLQGLVLGPQSVQLHPHRSVLIGQFVHLLLQLCLLLLQLLLLGDPLHPAAGGVAPVLQGAPALLQLQDLIFSETSEMLVQLPHRHGDQLLIRKAGAILPRLTLHLRGGQEWGRRTGVRQGRSRSGPGTHFVLLLTFKALFPLLVVVMPQEARSSGKTCTHVTLKREQRKTHWEKKKQSAMNRHDHQCARAAALPGDRISTSSWSGADV